MKQPGMIGNLVHGRTIAVYVAVVLSVSWLYQVAVLSMVGSPSSEAAKPFLLPLMFFPAIVAAGMMWKLPAIRPLVLWRFGRSVRYALPAVAVPTLIGLGVMAIVVGAGLGISKYFSFSAEGVELAKGPWLLGLGQQNWALYSVNVAVTALAFSVLNGLAAAGEEFGWRAFLQPLMIARFGTSTGITLLGLIWAAWHAPLVLAGYNYGDAGLLGATLLFPAELVAASFFLAWLTVRSGSFIPAALAHGATNSIKEGLLSNIEIAAPRLWLEGLDLTILMVVGLISWYLIERSGAVSQAGQKSRD